MCAFHAEHDDAAASHVNRVLRTNIGMGHEIWQDDRLVHREIYDRDA
jgi:hypothetical protein